MRQQAAILFATQFAARNTPKRAFRLRVDEVNFPAVIYNHNCVGVIQGFRNFLFTFGAG